MSDDYRPHRLYSAYDPRPHGGQHAGLSSGVLVYDPSLRLGVVVNTERSQLRNRLEADRLLDELASVKPDQCICESGWYIDPRTGHAPHCPCHKPDLK